jgi:hypothetical protein
MKRVRKIKVKVRAKIKEDRGKRGQRKEGEECEE